MQAARAALEPVGLTASRAASAARPPPLASARTPRAVGAVLAHEALGEDADERRGDQEVGNAEVEQARDRGGRVVGVQRREHQVAGEGRLHGVLGRLGVADLADHDDVRVLAQHGAQRAGEGDVDLRPDRDLVEVLVDHLDRVLDRDDVDLGLRQVLEHGVERRGLAAAGRAGDQDDAGGARDEVVELGQVVRREAELVDALAAGCRGRRCAARAFSPKAVGIVETRSSISRRPARA